ncbi:hypothetical protein KC722_00065 [Candidatus Kaiserbacteria bacterium]|nr:hypothetical protein [Candidatus Kaiserbacteria bacterium]MCB9811342.1 hypothetical protein [Candidatus Nomurabacteria bacterium]
MQDENDIPFNDYSVDYSTLGSSFFGGGSGSGAGAGAGGTSGLEATFNHTIDFLVHLWSIMTTLSLLVSALLLFAVIYAYIRASQYGELATEYVVGQEKKYAELFGSGSKNTRWEDVLMHSGTNNPNDWKLAIIEADIMLGELLDAMGLGGTTIGEKLKSASPNSFKTLDQAWRAHRVRNEIAHAGSDFVLTKKAAQDTITQYKMVFEEFELL